VENAVVSFAGFAVALGLLDIGALGHLGADVFQMMWIGGIDDDYYVVLDIFGRILIGDGIVT
jgi:hypothetical protein